MDHSYLVITLIVLLFSDQVSVWFLTVDSVRHEGHWPLVAVLVRGAPHTRRLHYHVIDDASGDQEVGEQDESEDGPGGGGLHPRRLLDFQVRDSENIENWAEN